VYNWHDDVKNFVITPEIRMRFYRMEVGQTDSRHSHDLGHEIFFILEGQCEMEVDGERAVLGPGQACVALRDQLHQAKNVGDIPVTMYLSVSPHVIPTHTFWTADPHEGGRKLPARYGLAYVPAADQPPLEPIQAVVGRYLVAAQDLFNRASFAERVHAEIGPLLERSLAEGDAPASRAQIDALWAELLPLLRAVSDVEEAWNALGPRAAGEPPRT
jgi:quercetin dioxygenase-like cupin family protein